MIKINEITREIGSIDSVNVEKDILANKLVFKCKNQVKESIKLTDGFVFVNFDNGVFTDRYIVDDVSTISDEEDYVSFTWNLGKNATLHRGTVLFNIGCEILNDNGEVERRWLTKRGSFFVETGLNAHCLSPSKESDAIAKLYLELKQKLDTYQGTENAGKVLTVDVDGNVIPAMGGGSVDFDDTITQDETTGKYGIDFADISPAGYSEGKAISGAQANELFRNLVALIDTKQNQLSVGIGLILSGNNIHVNMGNKTGDSEDIVMSQKAVTYALSLKQNKVFLEKTMQWTGPNNDILGIKFGNFDAQTGQYDSGMPASLDAVEAGCLYLWNSQIVPSFTRYYSKTEMEILLGNKADKSNTYTKTKVDEELSKKQGNLTAGNGIAIVNNIISAPLSRMPLDLNEGFVNIADVNDGWYQVTVPGRFGIANTNHKRYELYTGDTVYKEGDENNFVVMAVTNSGIYVVYNGIEDWGDGYLPNTDDINGWLDDKADKSSTYTKTEVDTALEGKQAVGNYALKSEIPTVENTTGESTTAAISQAFFTNAIMLLSQAFDDKQSKPNVDVFTSGTVTLMPNTRHIASALVSTLQVIVADGLLEDCSLTFTTGDTPTVSISAPTDMPIKWHGEAITTFEANTTYELDFRVVALPVANETTGDVEMVNTLIIAGGAVTEASE